MFVKAIGHFLAVCIGISLGLIGGGGSILAVPILVYVMGVGSKDAIAMSLLIVGTVSLIGVVPHWFRGNVNFKVAVVFTPAAMLGAYLGARLTALPIVTDTFQMICFGIVMLLASTFMIRQSRPKKAISYAEPPGLAAIAAPPKNSHPYQWLAIPAEGLGVGILTGFVGVGGGFLIIPALVLLGKVPMKQAIGTSLLIIAANSVSGFMGYVGQVQVDWSLVISFTIAATLGTLLGSYLGKFIDAKYLQKGFGYFVLIVGVFVLIQR